MSDWSNFKLMDFFDNKQGLNKILEYSEEIAGLPEKEQEAALNEISSIVMSTTAGIDDLEALQTAAVEITDSVYKSINMTSFFSPDMLRYIQATAAVFYDEIGKKGLHIQYLTNNKFDDMTRPLAIFPTYFAAAGLVYVCTNNIAKEIMAADEIKLKDYDEKLPEYLTESKMLRDITLHKCIAAHVSYIMLEMDGEQTDFGIPLAQIKQDGCVTVFRGQQVAEGDVIEAYYCERPYEEKPVYKVPTDHLSS